MDAHAAGHVRKLGHVFILQLSLIFFSGCALFPSKSTQTPGQKASAATFCLAPSVGLAADRIAAAQPASESAEKKLANGETVGVVEVAPMIALTKLMVELKQCVEQVSGAND